jgi:hypothetical protein
MPGPSGAGNMHIAPPHNVFPSVTMLPKAWSEQHDIRNIGDVVVERIAGVDWVVLVHSV